MTQNTATETDAAYAALLDKLTDHAATDPKVKALWIEGPVVQDLRRPLPRLEVHLAADEPHWPALVAEIEPALQGFGPLAQPRWSDTQRLARQLDALFHGAPVIVIVERTALLAKRKRRAVKSLVDKTGHLPHVLDYERA